MLFNCPFFLTESIITNVLQEKYGVCVLLLCTTYLRLGFSLGVEDDTVFDDGADKADQRH